MAISSSNTKCSGMVCERAGLFRCIRCRDAVPPTVYCSEECQRFDWQFHKAYCGKHAYTFDLTLIGSTNPVIKRTFDVPSWYTFEMLHFSIQYAMGPWQCAHLHTFSFEKSRPGERAQTFSSRNERTVMEIFSKAWDKSPHGGSVPLELEEGLKLSDVFEPEGRFYDTVSTGSEGNFCSLMYIYDMGDYWQHELIFKGKKHARADRPLFSFAQGCGPAEDCGAIPGWNKVKAAFRTPVASRGRAQKELIEWAQSGDDTYDPLKEPNVTQMNYEARWENHLRAFQGHTDEEFPEDSDFNDRDSGSEGAVAEMEDAEIQFERTGYAVVQAL